LILNFDWREAVRQVASIRILIVDDYEPWRRTVFAMLQEYPHWQVICEASDGVEAVEKSKELQPDLVLLDVGLPRLNGIEAARQIYQIAPATKILFVSENLCPEVVQEALCIGARGYVVKSDAGHDLLAAVEAVIADKRFVSSRFAGPNPPRSSGA
jgi:DNA-binding NarL/FixJ family response regulator